MNTLTRNDSPRFLTIGEAAVQLGVSGPTVRRWIKSGHLTAVQPGGEQGVLRVPVTELHRLAEGRDTR
jgi:excisionase family DNA binding protein